MKEKRIIVFIMLLLFQVNLMCYVKAEEVVNLQYIGEHNDRIEFYPPADMPEVVYYDSDECEIIIVSDGFSSYYDVVIIRNTPWQTVISTQISGYGDTIDISSLPGGNYTIVITSEYNNVFEGQFSII